MNQMNSFMKSVDARLTTLEKMVQQVATVQNQQSQVLDSVRASAHPPPSHAPSHAPSHTPSHAPSHPPPADLPRGLLQDSVNISTFNIFFPSRAKQHNPSSLSSRCGPFCDYARFQKSHHLLWRAKVRFSSRFRFQLSFF